MRLEALEPDPEIILLKKVLPEVVIGLLHVFSKLSHLPQHILAAISKKVCKKNPSTVPGLPHPEILGWCDQVPDTKCSVPEHTLDMAPLSSPPRLVSDGVSAQIIQNTPNGCGKRLKNHYFALSCLFMKQFQLFNGLNESESHKEPLWKERRQHFTAGGSGFGRGASPASKVGCAIPLLPFCWSRRLEKGELLIFWFCCCESHFSREWMQCLIKAWG